MIPNFSPLEIIENLKNRLSGKESRFFRMSPWYKGFTGSIKPTDESRTSYIMKGKFQVMDGKLIINELPIGKWTRDYKNMLEEMA